MKYIIELNGEESPIIIEEILDKELGRNCKCKVLETMSYRDIISNADESTAEKAIFNALKNIYAKGFFDGADKIIEKL